MTSAPVAPEFSRPVKLDSLGPGPRAESMAAGPEEREALARRFGLTELGALTAECSLVREGQLVTVTGHVHAALSQPCVATGEPVPATIDEPLLLQFGPPAPPGAADEEIELAGEALDQLEHDGRAVDLGEAVAQTLALALDPYPRSPRAAAALKAAGVKSEAEAGPFAALAALKPRE